MDDPFHINEDNLQLMQSQTPTRAKLIALNIAMALLYLLLAQGGQLLHLSPHDISPSGPAAALAFCAVLYFGPQLWFGIFAGSLLNYLLLVPPLSIEGGWLQLLWSGGSIAAAASVQAIASAHLVYRSSDVANGLIHYGDTLRLLLYGGPVGSLLGTAWGSLTFMLAGMTAPTGEWLTSWIFWWISDSLVIMATLPLLLIFLATPRDYWKRRAASIAIPLVAALLATLAVYEFISREQHDHLEAEFREKAYRLSDALEKRLLRNIEVLYSAQNLFKTSGEVDRAQFDSFVQRSLERNPGIQALGWNPVVTAAQRTAFEAAIQAEGFADFRINERDANGELVKAMPRDRYVAVSYIVPMAGNEKAFGFDIYSNPSRRDAIDKAILGGVLVATAPIRLVQETGDQAGVLFMLPVYATPTIPPFNQRDVRIRGLIVGVYRLGDLVSQAVLDLTMENIRVSLIDVSDVNDHQPLAYFAFDENGTGRLWEAAQMDASVTPLNWRTSFDFGQRDWQFRVQATPRYLVENMHWTAWLALAVGLMFCTLIGGFAMIISGSKQIDQETMENLGNEIRKRRQIESELHHANRELKLLATTDALTGIHNRRSIETIGQKLEHETRRYGESYSVFMIDIDHFKAINDRHGHQSGDQVLRSVVNYLQQQLRETDDMGRWGGEEFVIIARRVKHSAAVEFANRLVANMASMNIEPVGQVTISLGIASAQPEETFEQVLHRADSAMYQAKQNGRNQVAVLEPGKKKSAKMIKLEPR